MLSEIVEVKGFITVVDSLTGVNMTCDIKADVRAELNIVDEEAYQLMTRNESLAQNLKEYIQMGMQSAYHQVYPNGVEYTDIMNSAQPVSDAIRDMLAGLMEPRGLELVKVMPERLELSADSKRMFEMMRAQKNAL